MPSLRMLLFTLLSFVATPVLANSPALEAPLPLLEIDDRGELIKQGEDFDWTPWSSSTNPGVVHVIQYFGANLGDRDVFEPLTDAIQAKFEPGSVHVTTVLNMDAALWGTSGFVISELEKNKTQHPTATMVIDEDGTGIETWGLGKEGTGLIVMDKQGIVKYFTRGSPSEAEVASTIELIRANLGS